MAELAKVYEHIDRHFEEHLQEVQRFLRVPGVSLTEEYNPEVEEAACILADYIRTIPETEVELVPLRELARERGEEVPFGYPVVFGRVHSKNPRAKSLVLVCLYDLMPMDEDDWVVPPLSAQILDAERINLPPEYGKCIVARGACNQRGPLIGFINALKSMFAVEGDIPVNVIFAVEGEEEVGSVNFHLFTEKYREELLQAEASLLPMPWQDRRGRHHMFLGIKGVLTLEFEVKGGPWGGPARTQLFSADEAWVDAPVWRLIWALSTLHDKEGRVAVGGFYDHIVPPTPEERELLGRLRDAFDEEAVQRELGIARFKRGKAGRDLLEEYIMGPVFNIDGIIGGYTGPIIKTNLPKSAKVKVDIRLVKDQHHEDILRKLRNHFDARGFPEVEIHKHAGSDPVKAPPSRPAPQACIRAAERLGVQTLVHPTHIAFNGARSMLGSPPLNMDVISAGLGRMGRAHQSNEYLAVEGLRIFEKWAVTFLHEYAEA